MSTRPQKTKIIHAVGPEFLVSIPNKYSLHKHFILADKLNPTSTNNRTERLFWSTNFHYENIGEPCKCSPTTADLRRIKLFSSQSVTNERYKNTEQYSPFLILLWTGQLGMTR